MRQEYRIAMMLERRERRVELCRENVHSIRREMTGLELRLMLQEDDSADDDRLENFYYKQMHRLRIALDRARRHLDAASVELQRFK